MKTFRIGTLSLFSYYSIKIVFTLSLNILTKAAFTFYCKPGIRQSSSHQALIRSRWLSRWRRRREEADNCVADHLARRGLVPAFNLSNIKSMYSTKKWIHKILYWTAYLSVLLFEHLANSIASTQFKLFSPHGWQGHTVQIYDILEKGLESKVKVEGQKKNICQ